MIITRHGKTVSHYSIRRFNYMSNILKMLSNVNTCKFLHGALNVTEEHKLRSYPSFYYNRKDAWLIINGRVKI